MITFLASGFGFFAMLAVTLVISVIGFALGAFGLADNKPSRFFGGTILLIIGGVFSLLALFSAILNVIAFAKA